MQCRAKCIEVHSHSHGKIRHAIVVSYCIIVWLYICSTHSRFPAVSTRLPSPKFVLTISMRRRPAECLAWVCAKLRGTWTGQMMINYIKLRSINHAIAGHPIFNKSMRWVTTAPRRVIGNGGMNINSVHQVLLEKDHHLRKGGKQETFETTCRSYYVIFAWYQDDRCTYAHITYTITPA